MRLKAVTFKDVQRTGQAYFKRLVAAGWVPPEGAHPYIAQSATTKEMHFLLTFNYHDKREPIRGVPGFEEWDGYVGTGTRESRDRLEHASKGLDVASRLRDEEIKTTPSFKVLRIFEEATERAGRLVRNGEEN